MNGLRWTTSELMKLKHLYEIDGLCCSEISEQLNRPYYGIRKQIVKLKLKHSDEQEFNARQRIHIGPKNPMYGKDGPNKNLNKQNCERILISSEKQSTTKINLYKTGKMIKKFGPDNPMYNQRPWNVGLTKDTSDIILKYAQEDSVRKKEFWLSLPEEEQQKRRQQWAMQGLKCLKKRTSIEVKMGELLDSIGIEWVGNHPIGRFIVDVYIPKYNLVIECMGDYWHANDMIYKDKQLNETQLKNIDRDRRKKVFLTDSCINYLFYWEYDIKNNIKQIEEDIVNEIRAIGSI